MHTGDVLFTPSGDSYPSVYLNLPSSLSLSLSFFFGCLAGVPKGSFGAEAGEGKRGGAHSGWYGDPGPHTKLCGKVSAALCVFVYKHALLNGVG